MADQLPEEYQVTDEIVGALAERAVARGLELSRLRKLRDGYIAASQTLAVLARRHGADRDDIAAAIAAVVGELDRSGPRVGQADSVGKARLQLDGCRRVCETLMDLAVAGGADRGQLLEAVRASVDMHVKLRSRSTPQQLGLN